MTAGLVGGLTLAAQPAAAIELSYAYNSSNNGAVAEAMKWWADEVGKRTDGEVTVNIFWQQSLVKFQDTLPSVQSGLADMGEIAAAFSRAETPAWSLADTGSGSSDPYVATRAFETMRAQFPQIDNELAAAGVRYMWHYSWGGVVLVGKGDKPITHPVQYAGENVRVSSILARAISQQGWNANPVQIRFNEMFQGLQRGVVDGGSFYLSQLLPAKLNEVIDSVVEIDQGQHTGVVVMNADTWNSLSPNAQQAIDGLRLEMMQRLTRGEIEEAAAIREALTSDARFPVKLLRVSDEERQAWGSAMQASFQTNVERATPAWAAAPEFAVAYQAEIERVAARVAAEGHPWEG